jgi:endonuclease VIII
VPEGHTIHRLARDQAPDLVGRPLRVTSPQGEQQPIPSAQTALRAARALDGRRLERIDAHGKHLLYRFEGLDRALHVHLGLFGRFRRFATPPEPRPTDRLALTGEATWRLAGAMASRLLEPPEEDALLARLGPDPLRADADPERFSAALARRRSTIAAALMDQDVIAGVGNMFRAEVLWALELPPDTPSRAVDAAAVWDECRRQLELGVRRRRWTRGIYRRNACPRCGTPPATRELDNRTLWWCPVCQASSAASPRTTTSGPKVTSPRTTKRCAPRKDGAPAGKRASKSGTSLKKAGSRSTTGTVSPAGSTKAPSRRT